MKRIKMVLYGEPGTGKSVFASKAPKPFFICTDGNYEWLEEFGADPNAHANVSSFAEIKSLINDKKTFEEYETVVLDLTEDAFKWCEFEYCMRNKIDHLSDIGYGKAYDTTRNEFFVEICKLFALDKNVILLMHGITTIVKDRRGVEHTKYIPSTRIPDKVLDMIEGRVRYFLRCYVKDIEQEDGTILKGRYLSLVPKPNEFGIIRGVNESLIPQDIPLDWNVFVNTIGFNTPESVKPPEKKSEKKKTETKTEIKSDPLPPTIDAPPKIDENSVEVKNIEKETKEPIKEESPAVKKELTNEEKLAAIKAKLAAMKKSQ